MFFLEVKRRELAVWITSWKVWIATSRQFRPPDLATSFFVSLLAPIPSSQNGSSKQYLSVWICMDSIPRAMQLAYLEDHGT